MHQSSRFLVGTLWLLTGCAAPLGDPGEPEPETRATAEAEADDLLLHGELTRGGAPAAGGQVWVSVMADAVEAKPGDDVPTWESAVVSSDDQGHFFVSVDAGDLSGGSSTVTS